MNWLTNYQSASMREKKIFYNSWKNRIKKIPEKQKRVTVRDIKTSAGLQGWARRHLARRGTLAGGRGPDKMCKQ